MSHPIIQCLDFAQLLGLSSLPCLVAHFLLHGFRKLMLLEPSFVSSYEERFQGDED